MSLTILHIITRLILGGAQQNTIMTCAAHVRNGHRAVLAYGPIYGPEGSLLEEARASGAELVELKSMRRAILPGHDFLSYFELRRLIRRVKPDVVHTHSSKAGIVGRAAAWAERRQAGSSRPAIVHTVHGLPFHDRQNPIIHRAYVELERWAARRCDHLVAITPAMVDAFTAKGIAEPDRFSVIPSGVDVGKFEDRRATVGRAVRADLGIPVDAPVVGIVARLDPLKGHDDLLDVFPALRQRLSGLHMLFIGDGYQRGHLERRIQAEGLRDTVHMTRLVQHEQVARLLQAVDVKVLPSYQEGQSRTLIEALLCGCGIVAYNVGGMPSICIDGQTGRLAEAGDRDTLREAILWMFNHPQERRAMTQAGQALVREQYSAQRMVGMIEEVYARVLQRREQS